MRLYVSLTSPFARKCRIVVRELGLEARVEEVVVDPLTSPPELLAVNPIAQIPTLVDDAGEAFFDTPLICARLDAEAGGRLLPPSSDPEHWRVRRDEALGQAVMETAVKLVVESRRRHTERSAFWARRWTHGLLRALDAAETRAAPEPSDLGAITLAVAAAYLDFRHPEVGWRDGRPRLAELVRAAEQRPSFAATRPPG